MNNREHYYERTLASARTFFGRWEGAYAVLSELSRSHRALDIVLTHGADQRTNLVISCIGPIRISGPFEWDRTSLEISRAELPNHETGFRIADPNARFEVLCESVEVRENVGT